jgi:hypothetical protein
MISASGFATRLTPLKNSPRLVVSGTATLCYRMRHWRHRGLGDLHYACCRFLWSSPVRRVCCPGWHGRCNYRDRSDSERFGGVHWWIHCRRQRSSHELLQVVRVSVDHTQRGALANMDRYVTCSHTLSFANDLKLAHYVKIPPRHTFMAQVVATILSTFICTGILNYQMIGIPGVCTPEAANSMTCPGINTFFTASVLWGTIGPKKVFGHGGQYTALMAGWPLGVAIPLLVWCLQRKFPRQKWMRQIHPVLLLSGALNWAPYNLSWTFPTVWIGWLSWIWCKNRFVGFWSKYNFVLSAAFTTGISIAAIIIFFGLDMKGRALDWWGNSVVSQGCETMGEPCPLKQLEPGEYIGPGPGQFH